MTSSGFVLKHKNRKVFATGWTEEVWRSPVQVLRLEPFGKIRIFNIIFSIKIRYCYSCQVDPECSGWFNTSSFFFFFFLSSSTFLTFFSTFPCFLSHVTLQYTTIQTHTHTIFVTLLPDLTSLPSSSTQTSTCTHAHTHSRRRPCTHTTCFQAVIL